MLRMNLQVKGTSDGTGRRAENALRILYPKSSRLVIALLEPLN